MTCPSCGCPPAKDHRPRRRIPVCRCPWDGIARAYRVHGQEQLAEIASGLARQFQRVRVADAAEDTQKRRAPADSRRPHRPPTVARSHSAAVVELRGSRAQHLARLSAARPAL